MLKMAYRVILTAVAVATLAGCTNMAHVLGELSQRRDPRDAPWDPPPGRQLFEQIPNWDNAASRICCGRLAECAPHQSRRC